MTTTYQPFKNDQSEGTSPPAYGVPDQQQVAVQMPGQSNYMVHQPQQMLIMEATPKWSWCTLITAMFGFFCCQVTGFIAVVIAMLSYTDHKSKDFERSRGKRSISLCLGITSIVIGSLTILTVIILTVSLASAAAESARNMESFGN